MKKLFFFGLFSTFLLSFQAVAQKVLQEVIVEYVVFRTSNTVNNLLAKNKPIKVTLPKGTAGAFYRITVYNNEKVNTWDTFYKNLRVINPDTLSKEGFDFRPYLVEPNGELSVDVAFFTDKKAASDFDSGKEATACYKVEDTKTAVGMLDKTCVGEELYFVVKKKEKSTLATVKVEIVALADIATDPVNDRYPFSIQNELSNEIAYEVSGDRINWQAFFLPTKKKAEFKLADSQVYMRVSTVDKASEEYKVESGKKYRLYWNKDKNSIDLGEISPKK
ncbi:MAG: hypothetical protein ACK41O_15725 [Runella zeae]